MTPGVFWVVALGLSSVARPGQTGSSLSTPGAGLSVVLGSLPRMAIELGHGRVILSLYDASGVWSDPYREAGYQVEQVDLVHGGDVRLVERMPSVHGILAAPPCTEFSLAGNAWQRDEDDLLDALALVDAVLRLVWVHKPRWWALENPKGRLTRWLGQPQMWFEPWHFGDPWTKRTGLWGRFNAPQTTPVEPTMGSWMCDVASRDPAERSLTPPGFARAFFLANP